MTVQPHSTDEGFEVPGQLDLLNEIPGETRGTKGDESDEGNDSAEVRG